LFILQAADSFTMIHYLEYYSIHTRGLCGVPAALCFHHCRGSARRRRFATPRCTPTATVPTLCTGSYHNILASAPLSGAAGAAHTHYRSVLQRRTDKHSRLRLEHSSAACVNYSALGETLVNQLASYLPSVLPIFDFLPDYYLVTCL
jgi:hypothetical protein